MALIVTKVTLNDYKLTVLVQPFIYSWEGHKFDFSSRALRILSFVINTSLHSRILCGFLSILYQMW